MIIAGEANSSRGRGETMSQEWRKQKKSREGRNDVAGEATLCRGRGELMLREGRK
jgi:hypothetical protein